MTIFPQCFDCKHFDRRAVGKTLCSAFPDGDGIPMPILLNEHDHHEPYEGDHGIHFEPVPEPAETETA